MNGLAEALGTQLPRGWPRAVPWGLMVLLAAVLPGVVGEYWSFVLAQAAVTAIIVLSLSLLLGQAGQVSLAQSAFVGAGACVCAQLGRHLGWALWAALPSGVLAGFLLGLLVGLPALRLSGIYLAISTLGLAVVFDEMVFQLPQLGGLSGVSFQRPVAPVDLTSNRAFAYLCLGFLALVLFCLWRLRDSRTGWWLRAIRDDERAAQLAGIDVPVYKLLAFGYSGAMGALGGALLGYLSLHLNPLDFSAFTSITYLALVVVTGARTLYGALIAGLLSVVLPQLAGAGGPRWAPAVSLILPALLVIGIYTAGPGGRLGRQVLERWRERRLDHDAASM